MILPNEAGKFTRAEHKRGGQEPPRFFGNRLHFAKHGKLGPDRFKDARRSFLKIFSDILKDCPFSSVSLNKMNHWLIIYAKI
jgi:hypothetical protein